jgi:hypothetical protein
VGRGGGAAAGGGGVGRGGGAAAGGGVGAVGGFAAGGLAAGGGPFGGALGFPSGPSSSLACATTRGAVCACDANVASCVTVRAVVASSTMRRFVMMILVPGKVLAAKESSARGLRRIDQRLIIRPECGGLEKADAFYFMNATR